MAANAEVGDRERQGGGFAPGPGGSAAPRRPILLRQRLGGHLLDAGRHNLGHKPSNDNQDKARAGSNSRPVCAVSAS